MTTTEKKFPLPPWDMENAAEKLQLIEDAWNRLDAVQAADFFTPDADVRFGTAFLTGRQEVQTFLQSFWAERPGFKLKLDLWGALKGRMAVRFEFEWQDGRSYGVQVFQFDEDGYAEMNYASYNDQLS